MFHDLPIDIGRLPEPKIGLVNLRQEIRDVLALAEIAKRTEDDLTAKVALERWNSMFPNDQYKSTSLLLDVEGAEEDDDL